MWQNTYIKLQPNAVVVTVVVVVVVVELETLDVRAILYCLNRRVKCHIITYHLAPSDLILFLALPSSLSFPVVDQILMTSHKPSRVLRHLIPEVIIEPPGYLNLLYFPLKRIEFLVAQVVMPHCEEHLYHSACQGLIDVPWLNENLVSVNPEKTTLSAVSHCQLEHQNGRNRPLP